MPNYKEKKAEKDRQKHDREPLSAGRLRSSYEIYPGEQEMKGFFLFWLRRLVGSMIFTKGH